MKWFYSCPGCGKTYAIEPGRYLCDDCAGRAMPGQPLEGVLECLWAADADDADMRAAREGRLIPLPVEQRFFPPLPVGNTPLWAPGRLRKELDAPGLFLKDDTRNPSGSFKDRASWLVGAFALRHGIREIALASTGNAASSMACVGAAAGIRVQYMNYDGYAEYEQVHPPFCHAVSIIDLLLNTGAAARRYMKS